MSAVALICFVVYFGLAFVLRSLLQRRATGATGFKGISGKPGSAEWAGGVSFAVAIVLAVVAPILALTDVSAPIAALDSTVGHVLGVVLFAIGLGATLAAQSAMGRSWRIGVDQSEQTELVTDGPFAIVRNPIFAAMLPTGLGLVLLAPNIVAVIGFLVLFTALELQTRVVEEPYLLRAQGQPYAVYASQVGRFFPGIGTLRAR